MSVIPIQINGKKIKTLHVPALDDEQEKAWLYATLYNDIDIRANMGIMKLTKIVYVPHTLVNLLCSVGE